MAGREFGKLPLVERVKAKLEEEKEARRNAKPIPQEVVDRVLRAKKQKEEEERSFAGKISDGLEKGAGKILRLLEKEENPTRRIKRSEFIGPLTKEQDASLEPKNKGK